MKNMPLQKGPNRNRKPFYQDGKIYFSKETERAFFFILTLLMLLLGLMIKMGFFDGV